MKSWIYALRQYFGLNRIVYNNYYMITRLTIVLYKTLKNKVFFEICDVLSDLYLCSKNSGGAFHAPPGGPEILNAAHRVVTTIRRILPRTRAKRDRRHVLTSRNCSYSNFAFSSRGDNNNRRDESSTRFRNVTVECQRARTRLSSPRHPSANVYGIYALHTSWRSADDGVTRG